MTELSATAGSEGYAACDDDGGGSFLLLDAHVQAEPGQR